MPPPLARIVLFALVSVRGACQSLPTDAAHVGREVSPGGATPLILAKQGSFFVNAQNVATDFAGRGGKSAPGHVSAKGMYVQYQIPQQRNERVYPMIMVAGASHTAKCYEETPDGRMGWAEYFVRRGVPVYLVDDAGRGRSGFDASPINRGSLAGGASPPVPILWRFTNEDAWTIFRFGPEPGVRYPNSQFPLEARDQYYAQVIPNTEWIYPERGQNTIDALGKLLDRIGPAVLLVHSLSGGYGIRAAVARPELVRAVVSIEPRSCKFSEAEAKAVFARVPLLTIFGDLFGADVDDWPGRLAECVQAVERSKAAGGKAESIYLPDRGIRGNSHMLMMDLNNLQLADMILEWLATHASRP